MMTAVFLWVEKFGQQRENAGNKNMYSVFKSHFLQGNQKLDYIVNDELFPSQSRL